MREQNRESNDKWEKQSSVAASTIRKIAYLRGLFCLVSEQIVKNKDVNQEEDPTSNEPPSPLATLS